MINIIKRLVNYYNKKKTTKNVFKLQKTLTENILVKNNLLPVLLAGNNLNSFIVMYDSMVDDIHHYKSLLDTMTKLYNEETNYKVKELWSSQIITMDKALICCMELIEDYLIIKEKILKGPVNIIISVENQ